MTDTLTTQALPFDYEDIRPTAHAAGYWETNEEPDVHRELLKGLYVKRAAAIASAGEISLLTLLPKVRKELLLIDHSPQSLAVSMMKGLMISRRGADNTYALFTGEKSSGLQDALKEVRELLPEKLKSSVVVPSVHNNYSYNLANMRREWHYVPLRLVRVCEKKLSLVRFLHGDIGDLKERGKFDFLYLSNALEHQRNDGSRINKEDLDFLLPGAYVLSTRTAPYGGSVTYSSGIEKVWGWTLVKQERGFRTNWYHSLWQVPKGDEGDGTKAEINTTPHSI